MRLTTDEVNRIAQEVLNGQPLSIDTPEGRAMRAAVEKDVAKAKAAGLTLDLPNEIPDLDE